MQTLDIEQFKELVSRTGWTHESYIIISDEKDGLTYGFGKVISKLAEYEITAIEGIVFDGNDISTLYTGSEATDEPFTFKDFWVVNEFGKKLYPHAVYELINSNFYTVDYSELSKKVECHEREG